MVAPFCLRLQRGPLARVFRAIRSSLPPVNFITLHYSYFIITCLISAIIFWGSSTPARSVTFTDSLFLCVSAMTLAGLNTVNLSELNTWQQCMLFLLIMVGSAIFVSAFVVQVRKRAFEKRFNTIIEENKRKHRRNSSISGSKSNMTNPLPRCGRHQAAAEEGRTAACEDASIVEKERQTLQSDPRTVPEHAEEDPPKRGRSPSIKCSVCSKGDGQKDDRITFSTDTRFESPRPRGSSIFNAQGIGARPKTGLYPTTSHSRASLSELQAFEKHATAKDLTNSYFPSSGFISRNSQFFGLTEREREKLGGVEYQAICFLAWLVPLYFVLWQLLGCIGLGAYVAYNRPNTARQNGLNPWWVGAFNGVSAFNNSGMSLLDANMTAFQTSYYMLLTMGLMILAGNTCYPIFLRLGIWSILKLMPKSPAWEDRRKTLNFLLDHPRRCYTNLFPSEHTWWLAFAVIVLNGIDWAAFEILNIGNQSLNAALPIHIRVIDGFFQAIAVRSGGFYVVSIPTLRISLQILYVIMMYISVYPVVITMRNSNVYEERSLGIYADDPGYNEIQNQSSNNQRPNFWRGIASLKRNIMGAPEVEEGKGYFVRQQLRAQLAHDLWWIVLAVFLIMIIEGDQFSKDPANFSVFNVIFETVSGYGTVGISVGVPDAAYSFCGSWHKLSKLILCAVMLRGRHRGLPVAVDKAVLLPHEKQDDAEEEDAMIRIERANSRALDEPTTV